MSPDNVLDTGDLVSLAHHDLACYAIAQWPQFELAAHHELIVSRLEAVERGQISRLMVFLPPRHGKSLITSGLFPAWYLGRHPNRHIIFASYGQELSDDFGRRVRNYSCDPVHSAIFPECKLSEDSTAAHRFNTTKGGAYYAVGRGGPITGRGADLLIVDDPIKDFEEANSETVRTALHEWFRFVAMTRLTPNGAIILIQTRWHTDDLAGRLLREATGDEWDVLSLPAIAEHDESFRHVGEALWPERFPLKELARIRGAIGGRAWASLYQQRPAAAEGAIFKRDWWQSYSTPLTIPFNRIVQSYDTAFKTGAENDYSVCTTWGVAESGYYLLHVWRGRTDFPELKRVLVSLALEWKPNVILVEDRASGQSLIQELRFSTALPIVPVKVDKDKQTRAKAVTPLIEAGRVFLPEYAPWLNSFIDELASFPVGTHDDVVDATTQALNYLRQQPIFTADEFAKIVLGRTKKKYDKEEIWERAVNGLPITEQEFDSL